jgi:phosphatidylethanolamine-binding protein (PEBP) family uncharacterized protein
MRRTHSGALNKGSRAALAAVSILGAMSVVAGCGEATQPTVQQKAAAQQGAQSAGTTATGSTSPAPGSPSSATGNASPTKPAGTTHGSTPAGPGSGRASHRRAHLVLPGPNSRPAPKLGASQRASVSVADITLSSPAITQAHAGQPLLATRYTCQGADVPPPLRWTGVPPATQELVLFAISTRPVDGQLFFDWALAGLPGNLHGLPGGQLPPDAVLGRNGVGRETYSLCPAGGKPETYLFALYALPQKLSPKAGFDPATLRAQAIKLARHTGILFATYG